MPKAPPPEAPADFAAEMQALGVKPMAPAGPAVPRPEPPAPKPKPATPADEFLAAIGTLDVRFRDGQTDADEDDAALSGAAARPLRQLRRGQRQPEATLDLHGLVRTEVRPRLEGFLATAVRQGLRTVLVVTGRGLHSAGEPVLRTEAETYLRTEGRRWVAEWARAPKSYGGEGALVLFLRAANAG